MKSKTKAQLQEDLKEVSEKLNSTRHAAGRLRRNVFKLGLSVEDRKVVVALVDAFIDELV